MGTLHFSLLTVSQGLELRQLTPPGLHSEGPSWDWKHNGLLFVDIAANTLHFYDAKTGVLHGLTFGTDCDRTLRAL